ncbi:hypothetical protein C8J57DRAFT_1239846 [Mycena rebaudengoi]|nr:hypothetical protein C8J57DRAFT_1239846 [Mycena rebaudengoi]
MFRHSYQARQTVIQHIESPKARKFRVLVSFPVVFNGIRRVRTATESFSNKTQEHPPWFPFQTRNDFEVAEIAVRTGMVADIMNRYLNGINKNWHTGKSRLTIANADELDDVLASHSDDLGKWGASSLGPSTGRA